MSEGCIVAVLTLSTLTWGWGRQGTELGCGWWASGILYLAVLDQWQCFSPAGSHVRI